MNAMTQHVTDGAGDGSRHAVNGTGDVLPVPFSHQDNQVGIHWLRISFDKKHLADVSKWCSALWGDYDSDGYGLWSYDSRLSWHSGVSLNFDRDDDRSNSVHSGQITLDCPGGSLDELSAPDIQLLIEFAAMHGGKCGRIDLYFDDYKRIVSPCDLRRVIKRHDYSGLIRSRITEAWEFGNRVRDEVSFGQRGARGNGKYLRFYDKNLESKGQFDCCRWEVEFTHKKAQAVFLKLSACGGCLDTFATLIGSIIAGCITFVHRTGDKNISRLRRYLWWEKILKILGDGISIRVQRKKDSLLGKIEWVRKSISPSLACLRKVFVSDRHFFRWLFDICHEGQNRMNPYTEQIARNFEASIFYSWGVMERLKEDVYELSKLQ